MKLQVVWKIFGTSYCFVKLAMLKGVEDNEEWCDVNINLSEFENKIK